LEGLCALPFSHARQIRINSSVTAITKPARNRNKAAKRHGGIIGGNTTLGAFNSIPLRLLASRFGGVIPDGN